MTSEPSLLAKLPSMACALSLAAAPCMLVATILVAIQSTVYGNPVDHFGFGARASALGNAHTAASTDSSAVYYNPALIARMEHIHIDAGYRIALPSLRLNGRNINNDSSRGLNVGLAAPGRFGPLKLGAALAVFLPDQELTRVNVLPPSTPRFALYQNRPRRIFLGAAGSVAVGSRLWLGIGVAYMSNTEGVVTLDGRLGFPDTNDSDLALDIDFSLNTVRTPHAGIAAQVTDRILVGASYRHGFQLVLDQAVRIEGDVGPSGFDPIIADGFIEILVRSVGLFQPAQFNFGTWIQATPDLSIAFDVSYHRWSRFRNPAAALEIDGDFGDFNDVVNIPENSMLIAPNFRDIVVPRLGVEWQAFRTQGAQFLARGGYSFEPSPAPEQTAELNLVDNDKHTLSLGAGLKVDKLMDLLLRPTSFDASVAITILPERQHRKTSPVDPVGDYRSDGVIYQFALGSRWQF